MVNIGCRRGRSDIGRSGDTGEVVVVGGCWSKPIMVVVAVVVVEVEVVIVSKW